MSLKKSIKLIDKKLILASWEHQCSIGTITEEQDRFVCYVEQEKLNKYQNNLDTYKLNLPGIANCFLGSIEYKIKHGIIKPIYYIFDGIEFNKPIKLYSPNTNTIFKNCIFHKAMTMLVVNGIVFENNQYCDGKPKMIYETPKYNNDELVPDTIGLGCVKRPKKYPDMPVKKTKTRTLKPN